MSNDESIEIKKPHSRMGSNKTTKEFLAKYWLHWNEDYMDICLIKIGRFKLFLSLGFKIVSYEFRGTRQEIYDQLVNNKDLNAKIRKLKIDTLLAKH